MKTIWSLGAAWRRGVGGLVLGVLFFYPQPYGGTVIQPGRGVQQYFIAPPSGYPTAEPYQYQAPRYHAVPPAYGRYRWGADVAPGGAWGGAGALELDDEE